MDFIIWTTSGQSNGADKRKLVLLSGRSQDWTADREKFQY